MVEGATDFKYTKSFVHINLDEVVFLAVPTRDYQVIVFAVKLNYSCIPK